MGDQHVGTEGRGACVLLHAGIFGVIALDGAGVIASLHDGDKLIQALSRRHETSSVSGTPQGALVKYSDRETRTPLPPSSGPAWRTMRTLKPAVPPAPADTPPM